MTNVFYVPNFKFNLISVHKLTTATQSKFILCQSHCQLQDLRTICVLLEGKAIGSLYIVIDKCNEFLCRKDTKYYDYCNKVTTSKNYDGYVLPTTNATGLNCIKSCNKVIANNISAIDGLPTTTNTFDVITIPTANNISNTAKSHTANVIGSRHINTYLHTWNRRLAHAPPNVLKHIKCIKINTVVSAEEENELHACEACHKAKQTRLSFPTRVSDVSTIFELIHLDVWGLYTT